jgi:hypothetical protein
MARKPDERPRPEDTGPEQRPDRLGPVTIERLRKDDGRALLVYRVTEPAES